MKRVIFLVDMNAFFISCEMTRNPAMTGKPAAVAGDPKMRRGIILAANYDARKFGVKTTMAVHEALRLCPDMIIVPPDHEFYEAKSREVMALLARFAPVVEQNSIDEAWLDMTGCEKLYKTPLEAAAKIMASIRDDLGLWCSIGIAENKFLAKMASEMKKPLGITELWNKDIPARLWPLPVRAMYGIGKQTAEKFKIMGIETIGDLAHYRKEDLFRRFGKYGTESYFLANGLDDSPVVPHSRDEVKSIGRSVTLPENIIDLEQAKKVIMHLSEEVGADARRHGKKGRTVQVTVKYSDFRTITRQMAVPSTYLTKDINSAGMELLRKNWDKSRPVRLLGITLSGFSADVEMDQISLFSSESDEKTSIKEEKLERAMDAIRKKHGMETINRAALLENKTKKE